MNEFSDIYSYIRVEQNIVSAPSGPGRVYQTWHWEPSVRERGGDMIFPTLYLQCINLIKPSQFSPYQTKPNQTNQGPNQVLEGVEEI